MPIPNKNFVNSLYGLDTLLSVRWGDFANQWVIERKSGSVSNELNYLIRRVDRVARLYANSANLHINKREKLKQTWVGLQEELESAKLGKRIILFTKELNSKIYDALVLADMSKYGGYARFADKIEQEELKMEKDLERSMQEQRLAMNKETFDMLNFVWRKKEDYLLNGERDLGFMLHGKRTTKDSAPLISITDF